MIPLKRMYHRRFPDNSLPLRKRMWETIYGMEFRKYITPSSSVMDIGAGYCGLINAVHCKKRVAVDINPDIKKFAAPGVTVLTVPADAIPARFTRSMDIIFISHFLEHLESKDAVFSLLTKVKRFLKPGGKLIILQPNIDLARYRYWDFFDHNIIFNTENIREVLELSGYTIDTFVERFLPYSTKNTWLPVNPFLVRCYLSLPEWLRPWAGQSLIIARGA